MNKSQLPGLSIVRTLAAFSVLFGHMYLMGSWGGSVRVWLPEIYLPVTTFFVISGFLITWGLLREFDSTGDVSVGNAYKRRAKRILPMYYIGVGVGLLTLWLCGQSLDGELSLVLCLIPNISHIRGTTPFPLWHYWTMGTEIMFYLWFPWLIKYGRKHVLALVVSICALWLLMKYGIYYTWETGQLYRFFSATQFDTIMFGSIGAVLYYNWQTENHADNALTRTIRAVCSARWFAFVIWCVFLSTNLWVPILPAPIRPEVIGVISILLILSAFCGNPVGENAFTQYIAKLSYGIYIFHPIVIFVCSRICEEYHLIASNYWLAGLQVLTVVIVSIAISAVFDKVVAALLKLAK